MNLFLDILVGLLGQGIGPSQGLCLHRTAAQHRKTRTYIHASSGIRIHDPKCSSDQKDRTCLIARPLGPASLCLQVWYNTTL